MEYSQSFRNRYLKLPGHDSESIEDVHWLSFNALVNVIREFRDFFECWNHLWMLTWYIDLIIETSITFLGESRSMPQLPQPQVTCRNQP